MSKINLITRHWGTNNGAFLQTYATQKYLETLGHNVTIINLIWKKNKLEYLLKPEYWLTLKNRLDFALARKKFYHSLTASMYQIDIKKIPKADYFISGSDQIWNPKITKENAFSYFLDFAGSNQRISLSSSFGAKKFQGNIEQKNKIRIELKKYKAISVRETSGVDICRNTFNVDAIQLIDPVFLFDKYPEISQKFKLRHEIIAFLFEQNNSQYINILEKLSERLELPVRVINHRVISKHFLKDPYRKFRHGKWTGGVAPKKFLQYICSADYIVTNSFHGIAISILYRKQFSAVIADPVKFERIFSLLKIFHLENRIIYTDQSIQDEILRVTEPIIYDKKYENIISEERKKYKDFISENIK